VKGRDPDEPSTSARDLSNRNVGATVYTSPAWLPFALTFVTGGAYLIVWAGRSWSTMKRERGDSEMRPVWHALSLVVPLYMVFRVHAHFRTLNELLSGIGARERANLAVAVGAFAGFPLTFIATGTFRTGLRDGSILLIAALCAGVVAGYGQHYLNAYLSSRSGSALVSRVDAPQWIALVVFAVLMASYVLASWMAVLPRGSSS
jgi:hypothetical protein